MPESLSPDAIPMGDLYRHTLLLVPISPCAKQPEEKHGLISWEAISLLGGGQAPIRAQPGLLIALFNGITLTDHIVCNGTLAEENDDYAVKREQCSIRFSDALESASNKCMGDALCKNCDRSETSSKIETISIASQGHSNSKFGPKNLTLQVFLFSKRNFDMRQCACIITFLHFLISISFGMG